ncbi:hypothetical protein [Vibrio comitans]|uniref:Uncharacterized protein n=1 Tax=Vibrio comitans NBRC 102076 TaxID=1219078 RepID=A0A4Y3IIK1_9VIBR|nr:hypothetical protein [Vibrio comitans]GEA58822.1 hypothetical protein VCO01S_00150 [Vibrio comitans NBRC 102076]
MADVYKLYEEAKKLFKQREYELGLQLDKDRKRIADREKFTELCQGIGLNRAQGYKLAQKARYGQKYPETIRMTHQEFDAWKKGKEKL